MAQAGVSERQVLYPQLRRSYPLRWHSDNLWRIANAQYNEQESDESLLLRCEVQALGANGNTRRVQRASANNVAASALIAIAPDRKGRRRAKWHGPSGVITSNEDLSVSISRFWDYIKAAQANEVIEGNNAHHSVLAIAKRCLKQRGSQFEERLPQTAWSQLHDDGFAGWQKGLRENWRTVCDALAALVADEPRDDVIGRIVLPAEPPTYIPIGDGTQEQAIALVPSLLALGERKATRGEAHHWLTASRNPNDKVRRWLLQQWQVLTDSAKRPTMAERKEAAELWDYITAPTTTNTTTVPLAAIRAGNIRSHSTPSAFALMLVDYWRTRCEPLPALPIGFFSAMRAARRRLATDEHAPDTDWEGKEYVDVIHSLDKCLKFSPFYAPPNA